MAEFTENISTESSLDVILQLKNDQIRILKEIIDNKEIMIRTLKDQNQFNENHIVKLNSIIDDLKLISFKYSF